MAIRVVMGIFRRRVGGPSLEVSEVIMSAGGTGSHRLPPGSATPGGFLKGQCCLVLPQTGGTERVCRTDGVGCLSQVPG